MPVNFLAVLVAVLSSIVVGSLWFGPLFGKRYMKEMGMDQWTPEKREKMKKKMWLSYLLQFVASFVMFFFLGGLIIGFGQTTVGGGVWVGFTMWLGFVVPVKLGDAVWGGKMSLFWLGIGNMLVTLLVGGAILGAWL